MPYADRKLIYEQIEALRGRPLIAYVTSERQGAPGAMASDAIRIFIDQIRSLPPQTKEIDILIESSGGDPLVSWRLMSMIREKVDKIYILIPYSAFSAATLLALGGDEIILGDFGCLGPIDPQITAKKSDGTFHQFAYLDIVSFLNFIKNDAGLTEQKYLENTIDKLLEQVDPSTIGMSKRAASLSVTMAEKLLNLHMDGLKRQEAKNIAQKLYESFFSHGHAVGKTEAREIGLTIVDPDEQLADLMWQIHKDIEDELQTRKPFDPIAYFLSQQGADIFCKSPPPVNIPMQVPPQEALKMIFQIIQNQIQGLNVPDVSVKLKHALIESTRCASHFEAESKILLTRTPDLKFIASLVKVDHSWTDISTGQ